jgi:hypothetical protein
MLLFSLAQAIPPFLKRGNGLPAGRHGGLEHVSVTSKANPPNLLRQGGVSVQTSFGRILEMCPARKAPFSSADQPNRLGMLKSLLAMPELATSRTD